MNPQLKKIIRNRGQQQNPRSWQENGWQADKCPKCSKPLFSWYDESSHQRCDECGYTT